MSKTTKFILFLLFSVSIAYNVAHKVVHAGEGQVWGEYHVGSNHSKPGYNQTTHYRGIGGGYTETKFVKYNEQNTGGGLVYEVSDTFEVSTGFYKNSFNNTTLYGAVDFHMYRTYPVAFGITIGRVSGYRDVPGATDYMALPNIVFGTDKVRVKVGYIPFGDVKVTTLTVGLAFR